MDLGLKDRVYVVTGATRGLGNAAARELVADGAKVVITGRDEKRVADAAAALGPNAVGVAADNADPDAAGPAGRGRPGALRRLRRRPDQRGRARRPGSSRTTRTSSGRPAFESVFLGAVRLARAAAGGARRGRGHRVRAVRLGARADLRADHLQRAAARASPGSPSRSPTSWARAASGSSACCRPGSTPTGCASWTRCPPTRRPPGRRTSRGSRCAATGRRRSSGGPPPSCSRRPRPI